MRPAAVCLALVLSAACQSFDCGIGLSDPPVRESTGATIFPLRVNLTGFIDAAGHPFPWRGITAFRLAEMVAHGREREAIAYLDWAKSEQLTVLRVLAMGPTLFKLPPDEGRKALPRLLDLAKERGLAVEVVAFADTIDQQFDYQAHVRELGRIATEKGNALIEMANEPGHPTQDRRLHDPAFVKQLADLLPAQVIVAFGSVEYGEGYAAGDYATFHFPRGPGVWDHVWGLAAGARRVAQLQKPVISDEPIGAGAVLEPGRRDNEPSRFAAAAALTRLAGMGATFHYNAGIHTAIPGGREAVCLAAWQTGLALLEDAPAGGEFLEGDAVGVVANATGARRVFARVSGRRAAILLIDPRPEATPTLAAGWKETGRSGVPGVRVVFAERSSR